MVDAEICILTLTAFFIGVLHTILGPDHYIPFVAIARSSNWSPKKTFWITAFCGVGHVLGSVVVGAIGLLMGTALIHLQALESLRGESAGWLVIGFGLAYLTWGLVQAIRNIPNTHEHSFARCKSRLHLNKTEPDDCHVDDHQRDEMDPMGDRVEPSITPWVLFLIFAFGPCEALIPLVMYPAANSSMYAMVAVALAFAAATIGTMLATVMLIIKGLNFVELSGPQRFSHAFAGLAILVCGVLIKSGW